MAESPLSNAPVVLRLGEEVISLGIDRMVVGRSRSCEIRLKEDTVSRLHAALFWREGRLYLEDLGSSNGTFVNGQRVTTMRAVSPGDVVRFGALRGSIERLGAAGVTAPIVGAPEAAPDYTVGVVSGVPAGFGWRLAAVALDLILFTIGSLVPFAPLLLAALAERSLLAPDAHLPGDQVRAFVTGGCAVLWLVYLWYYAVHGWARRGGTPGLRLCGLRLADYRNNVPIGYSRAWLRLAAVLVTFATLGVGLLFSLFRADRKALHDLLAGTLVVHRSRFLPEVGAAP